MDNKPKVVLVGAGGMSFGPVMAHDAIQTSKISGGQLMLHDINEDKLENAYASAARLNEKAGSPINLDKTSDIETAYKDADFVIVSTEIDRFPCWKMDYQIPVKHGSTQIMGENGGPGAVFHSLRSIKTTLEICRNAERICPDAFLLNLTNPMSRVTLAINKATKLRNVGLCHEFEGGKHRIALYLLMPPKKVKAKASGINHFTFFYEIEHADTGEDLYPKLRKHIKQFPFLYPPLLRHLFKEYDHLATSSDSHIGEYVPFAKEVVGRHIEYNEFFKNEGAFRDMMTRAYGKGFLPLPIHKLPRSTEQVFPIIEALHTGERAYIDAVNVPNKGYVPNLPEGAMVEVPAYAGANGLEPETVPSIHQPLADFMDVQIKLQELVVEAALTGNPDPAFESLKNDPLSPPSEADCRAMFDEMMEKQKKYLPF